MVFRFGDGCKRSIVKIIAGIPTEDDRSIEIDVDIVDEDITLLVGMDVFRRHKIVLDFGRGQILQREGN